MDVGHPSHHPGRRDVDHEVSAAALVRPYIHHAGTGTSPHAAHLPESPEGHAAEHAEPWAEPAGLPPSPEPPRPHRTRSRKAPGRPVRTVLLWLLTATATATAIGLVVLVNRGDAPGRALPAASTPGAARDASLPAERGTLPAAPQPRPPADTVWSRPSTGPGDEPDAAATTAGPGPSGTTSATSAAPAPSARTSSPRPAGPRSLGPGDTGPDVAHLQEVLHTQGKTYVSTNGTYDAATEQAVREVQRERGITDDPPGVYGPATRASLG